MAKISALTPASTLDGTEQSPAVQSSTTVRTTLQAIANLFRGTRGSSIASAGTIDLGAATGTNLHITGTTTITSLGTAASGIERTVIFDGVLVLTHNATSLILPNNGSNITTAAGDSARFVSEGSGNWKCVSYQRLSGATVSGAASIAGPGSSTDNAVVRFDGTGGNTVQNSGVIISDNNELSGYAGNINAQTGTTYTLVTGDAGKIITFSNASAITVTLPNSLPAGFCCTCVQKGAGQVTFTPASGASRNNRSSHTKTAGQYAMATLYVDSNSGGSAAAYFLGGDTAS